MDGASRFATPIIQDLAGVVGSGVRRDASGGLMERIWGWVMTGSGFDFGVRKNEPIGGGFGCRIVRFGFGFVEVVCGLAGGAAFGLKLLQLSERFFQCVVEAPFIEAQVGECGVFA